MLALYEVGKRKCGTGQGADQVNWWRRPLGTWHAGDGAVYHARPRRQRAVAQQLSSAMYEPEPLGCCKLALASHLHLSVAALQGSAQGNSGVRKPSASCTQHWRKSACTGDQHWARRWQRTCSIKAAAVVSSAAVKVKFESPDTNLTVTSCCCAPLADICVRIASPDRSDETDDDAHPVLARCSLASSVADAMRSCKTTMALSTQNHVETSPGKTPKPAGRINGGESHNPKALAPPYSWRSITL